MTVPKEIFREYDIRGVATPGLAAEKGLKAELTPAVAEAIGAAYGGYILKKGAQTVSIGADNRVSSPELKAAVIAGLTRATLNVVDIGTVVTPMVYFSCFHFDFPGGGAVQVTASHNPPEDNGIKLRVEKKPLPVGGTAMIYERIQKSKGKSQKDNSEVKSGETKQQDILDAYIQTITKGIKLGRKLKVVIDTGNGTGGLFVRRILDRLGVDSAYLFEESDGTFPNHIPDPQVAEEYTALKERVRASDADVGIALDGDCDRMNATDETGAFLGSDKLAILFSREVLRNHPGAGIVVNAVMSQAILDDVKAHGGRGFIGKAGYPNIGSRMQETGALLGNEASGHFFFADEYYGYDDALYAMIRLLSFISQSDRPVTEILADMPQYTSTPEYRVAVSGDRPDERKFAIVAELIEEFKSEGYTLNTIDGARVQFPDHGGWGIVRASNTQPKLSMRMEAKTEAGLEGIQRIFKEKMRKYREVQISF